MKTTISGQLFLSLWTEKLVKAIPDIKFLQHNTDGITFLIKRKDLNKALAVEKEMTALTGLTVETNFYKKMILKDVNNYQAVYEDSTKENEHIKLKGCFEIDKELHKDSSMKIVPIALKNYFIYGIPIRDTILNHKNIYDFCLRLKINSTTNAYWNYIDNGTINKLKLNRTTRYYISNSGGTITKVFNSGSISGVNVGYSTTLFNKYTEKEDYDINYDFYINECKKIIDTIEVKQLSLF